MWQPVLMICGYFISLLGAAMLSTLNVEYVLKSSSVDYVI